MSSTIHPIRMHTHPPGVYAHAPTRFVCTRTHPVCMHTGTCRLRSTIAAAGMRTDRAARLVARGRPSVPTCATPTRTHMRIWAASTRWVPAARRCGEDLYRQYRVVCCHLVTSCTSCTLLVMSHSVFLTLSEALQEASGRQAREGSFQYCIWG
jgi:hypothetical protein